MKLTVTLTKKIDSVVVEKKVEVDVPEPYGITPEFDEQEYYANFSAAIFNAINTINL